MSQTVSWITVLNEETEWRGRQDISQWATAIFGNTFQFADHDLDRFEETLSQMRSTIDSLHFGNRPDINWLDARLTKIKLTVSYESFLPQAVKDVLPVLHAQVQGNSGHDLLEALVETLLIQFAEFIGGALQDEQAPTVARCEGLFKATDHTSISMVRSIPETSERKWRDELEILRHNDMINEPEVQRCADIFIGGPKARFCSDACRFTTFQLVKQLKNPRYHADKQKRYRSKLADK